MVKKSIILSGVESENQKAVLSLEFDGNNLQGRVRLYNFQKEPTGILSLGILTENGVLKAGLNKEQSMLFSFNIEANDLPSSFSCAIVNFSGGSGKPIMYGASQGAMLEEQLKCVMQNLQGAQSMQEVEEILDENGIDFDEEEKAQIESAIDGQLCPQCAKCKYKEAFFSESETSKGENLTKGGEKPFYSEIEEEANELFAHNKSENYLEEIIPNSKWVKVEFESSGDYYVFGLIFKDDKPQYVCYGVPGVYQPMPPKQLAGFPTWLPLDDEKKDGFGYWITYQDAQTGESIKAVIE